MQVRKMRLLRLKYQISLPELAQFCGISPQRISEIELNPDVRLDRHTAAKVNDAFASAVEQRYATLEQLESEYHKHKDTLLDCVEETTYEL